MRSTARKKLCYQLLEGVLILFMSAFIFYLLKWGWNIIWNWKWIVFQLWSNNGRLVSMKSSRNHWCSRYLINQWNTSNGLFKISTIWSISDTRWSSYFSTIQFVSQVAVVYAGPTFHDEVASVVACILHNLGYYVVVYIGNGVHFAGMMIPFSGLFWIQWWIYFCDIL